MSKTLKILSRPRGNAAHKIVIRHNVDSFIESQRQQHSKKPDIVRDRIVDLVGDGKRVEIFARDQFQGWDAWGNEL